jgi:phosphatidylserine/phosphatidylglycerophosphate/cardiolipin synthase-like enzyme
MSEALIDAKKRGVDVRVIIDANSVSTRGTKHAKLRNAGIVLKTENYAGKMHSKAMIIDDQYFITGSMNFSYSGANKNDENTLIIKDKKIAEFHKNIFLYLWTKIPNRYLNKNAKPESPDSIGSCVDGVDNNFNNKTDKEESYCNI